MTTRYRYFALVSCSILAYFILSSQYLYQNFQGKHPMSLQNVSTTLFFIDRNKPSGPTVAGLNSSSSGKNPSMFPILKGTTNITVTAKSNNNNDKVGTEEEEGNIKKDNSPHRVVVGVKYSTSVVEMKSSKDENRKLPAFKGMYNAKSNSQQKQRPEQHQVSRPGVSQQQSNEQNLTTTTTNANIKGKEPDAYDPTTKWFQIIKDTANKIFGLTPAHDLTEFRKWAVEKARGLLQDEMRNFDYPVNKSLDDYAMERGGQPVRNLVFTTWRSGSTFLGEILHSHPGTFYHYEPLLHFGLVQVREGAIAEEAVRVIRELLNCRYKSLGAYMKNGERQHWVFNHNKRVWNFCSENRKVCWDPQFLSNMCRMFPFQALKTVRMRLDLARPLLEDDKLNVRVLYLIRDPRGTIQSRFHRDWCPHNPDCEEPELLCSDLVKDYYAAEKLRKQYPGRFMLVRYEDMAGSIYNAVKKIFKFFRLEYHPQVKTFLDVHTKSNFGGVSSTYRDTKSAPFHWMRDLAKNFTIVENIQNSCREAMDLWGYDVVESLEELKGFNPVNSPPWEDMKIEPIT